MSDPLSTVRGDVRIWVNQAPPAAIACFQSVILMNELCRFRNVCFQMPGAHDGSISDECKQVFREHFEALDEFINAVRSVKVTQ